MGPITHNPTEFVHVGVSINGVTFDFTRSNGETIIKDLGLPVTRTVDPDTQISFYLAAALLKQSDRIDALEKQVALLQNPV